MNEKNNPAICKNRTTELIEIVKELTEMQKVYLKGVATGMAAERKIATDNQSA